MQRMWQSASITGVNFWDKAAVVTFCLAFLVILAGSPPHPYETDPMFWFLCAVVVGLIVLATSLHYEPSHEERQGCIRVFFILTWVVTMLIAASVVWKNV